MKGFNTAGEAFLTNGLYQFLKGCNTEAIIKWKAKMQQTINSIVVENLVDPMIDSSGKIVPDSSGW